jgi:hypothetical protein
MKEFLQNALYGFRVAAILASEAVALIIISFIVFFWFLGWLLFVSWRKMK